AHTRSADWTCDRVLVRELPPNSVVEQTPHRVPDLRLGSVRPGHGAQPLLHRDGSNLINWSFPPARENPAIENRLATVAGRVGSALIPSVHLFVLREMIHQLLRRDLRQGRRALVDQV